MSLRLLFLALLTALMAAVVDAHQPKPATIPPDAPRGPVLAGAADFQLALMASPFVAIDERQRETLAQAGRLFDAANQVEKGDAPGRSPSEAPMLRGVASTMVLSVVRDLATVVRLDFTSTGSIDIAQAQAQPPLRGAVLIETIMGEGPTDFAVRDLNLGWSGDSGIQIRMDMPAAGTRYALVRLEDIPFGRHVFSIQFVADGAAAPSRYATIALETGEPGQLGLTVVDESGASTPALVRLVSKATGLMWEPPNAIDLKPIMTDITKLSIYGPGRGYTHYMPGEFRGTYWIVPSGFEVVIPPGEWELFVHRGYEFVPVRRTIEVKAGAWTRERVEMRRWIDMPARGWWSGDDHVHSRLVSSEDAASVLAWAKASDVHVANILEMGDQVRTWYEQRGHGPDFRVADGGYVLVPGQEDPRSQFGHIIGLNLTSMVRDTEKYLLNDWVADEIAKQGGLYGNTHVGEGLFLGAARDMTLLKPHGKGDFASIMQNTLGTDLYYEFLDLGFRIVASAGSDTPYGGSVGLTRVYVNTGAGKPLDADVWFAAMKAGRTFVTNGPMLDLKVEGAIGPGEEIVVAQPRTLKVRATVEGRPGGSSPSRAQLVYNGEVVHEVANADPTQGVVALEFDLPVSFGGWLALRGDGHDGSRAHTTPVYIVREGFRPWNHARVAERLAQRRAILDEIQHMLDDALAMEKEGRLQPIDYWNRWMVTQAQGVQERIDFAREYYDGLEKLAAEEAPRRQVSAP